jgi:D-alanyl-D-alanine dipeptidase
MFDDERKRRAYWTSRLDEAHDFMMRVMAFPVIECEEKLVPLAPAAAEAKVEVAFSSQPHVKGLPRLFFLRQGQIRGFLNAAQEMNRRGWVLKVEDGFRNRTMQKFIGRTPAVFDAILTKVLWELEGRLPDPAFMFKRVMTLTAQMPKIGTHMSGSAIDISVLDRRTGQDVDRGGPYLEISERTPMSSPFISAAAQRNREDITAIMAHSGFVTYPYEFWHYNSGDAYEQILRGSDTAAIYGAVDMDPATGVPVPVMDPAKPLNDLHEIEAEIQSSLQRLAGVGQINP